MWLQQIIVKLWKFFLSLTDGISGQLYVSQSVVFEMATMLERVRCVGWLFETGQDGTITWPPRSPDITPLDLFL
jgi:hypothetical protein